mmetsp:Transcript_27070/g.52760  ORF Transcript_27070/g.52760 Transcript_27070/m.52760 type:complete len:270 (-) Transcript_27070:854-1663(-)
MGEMGSLSALRVLLTSAMSSAFSIQLSLRPCVDNAEFADSMRLRRDIGSKSSSGSSAVRKKVTLGGRFLSTKMQSSTSARLSGRIDRMANTTSAIGVVSSMGTAASDTFWELDRAISSTSSCPYVSDSPTAMHSTARTGKSDASVTMPKPSMSSVATSSITAATVSLSAPVLAATSSPSPSRLDAKRSLPLGSREKFSSWKSFTILSAAAWPVAVASAALCSASFSFWVLMTPMPSASSTGTVTGPVVTAPESHARPRRGRRSSLPHHM